MNREDVIRWAREAEMDAMVGRMRDGKYEPKVNALKKSVSVEWLERFAGLAIAAERQKRREAEGMAECMDMVRQDLIEAGIIDKSVPPMMVPEAVVSTLRSRVEVEREACAKVCEARFMGDLNREDEEARRCAEAIRARGNP